MSWKAKIFAFITLLCNFFLFFSYMAFLSDPIKTSWIAFTGLTYPLIVIINILFCLIWLLKRKLFFLPTLILLIGGMYHHSRYFQISLSSQNTTKNSKSIKIMSYNVRLFDLYNWKENKQMKQNIIKMIQSEDPDVICFQEYYFNSSNDFITRDMIIKELKMPYYYESFSDESKGSSYFGIATFSKFPIINKGNLQFNNDHSNQCI